MGEYKEWAVVECDGFKLEVPKGRTLWRNLTVMGLIEPFMTKFILSVLDSDMVFVDVGAQYGYYTFLAAARCKKVIAFEPDDSLSWSTKHLLRNVQLNDADNVVVERLAVGSDTIQREYDADVVTLDDYLDGEHVDCIKIDVEGAEMDVLLGAKETIMECRPYLGVEVHNLLPDFGYSKDDISIFLDDMGYNVSRSGMWWTARPRGKE